MMLWAVIEKRLAVPLRGAPQHITICLRADGGAQVIDRTAVAASGDDAGRRLDLALTTLIAWSRFDDAPGIGVTRLPRPESLSVTNALAAQLIVNLASTGYHWHGEYERGEPRARVNPAAVPLDQGFALTFWPDAAIFGTATFDLERLVEAVHTTCYLNPDVTIDVIDARTEPVQATVVQAPDGLCVYVGALTQRARGMHPPIGLRTAHESTVVAVAFQYTRRRTASLHSYANYRPTERGGTHVDGFETALVDTLQDLGGPSNGTERPLVTRQAVRRGLTAVIAVWTDELWLRGATLASLANPEVREHVHAAVRKGLADHFSSTPHDLARIYRKVAASD
jgi:DNA gyrase subunit B